MRAFVAVAEAGGVSAAARVLHVSQPALSQTLLGLERRLGVALLVRSSTGTTTTPAGELLLVEARAILAKTDRAVAAVRQMGAADGRVLRLGAPLELPSTFLPSALRGFADRHPDVDLHVRHLSSSAQLVALSRGDLDVALLRSRPADEELDAIPVIEEELGVLVAEATAASVQADGVLRLEALGGLSCVLFPRSDAPAWHDELTAVLRSHGVATVAPDLGDQPLIAEVKLAAVQSGHAFAFAPPHWSQPVPAGIVWYPLAGRPVVRRTWATWIAASRRRDLADLVAVLERGDEAERGRPVEVRGVPAEEP